MTDEEKMVDALRHLCQDKDARGRPIKGKLKHIVLSSNGAEGWQCIAQFWFVDRWNIAVGPDPIACILKSVSTAPNMEPLSASTPAFITQREPEPEDVEIATPYEEDLLV